MTRTLLIIAGAATVLAVATLAGAFAVGGRDLAAHGWNWTLHDNDGDSVRFERTDGTRPATTTRSIAWTGGERLRIDLSADVEYIQGDQASVQVIGPAGQVQRVRLEGDRLTWDDQGPHQEHVYYGRRENGRGFWVSDDGVRIVVTAPSVKRFDLNGSSDLTLTGYDQDTLDVDVTGSGDVAGTGRARTLNVSTTGSGDVDLSDLAAFDARVQASGSGDVNVAATGAVNIDASGSGDIRLAERPSRLTSSITGSGELIQD